MLDIPASGQRGSNTILGAAALYTKQPPVSQWQFIKWELRTDDGRFLTETPLYRLPTGDLLFCAGPGLASAIQSAAASKAGDPVPQAMAGVDPRRFAPSVDCQPVANGHELLKLIQHCLTSQTDIGVNFWWPFPGVAYGSAEVGFVRTGHMQFIMPAEVRQRIEAARYAGSGGTSS